jgi:hypothetical protein
MEYGGSSVPTRGWLSLLQSNLWGIWAMHIRQESAGWGEKQEQREALLRALSVVNLQITAMTEHMAYIEERIRHLERDSSDLNADARDAA